MRAQLNVFGLILLSFSMAACSPQESEHSKTPVPAVEALANFKISNPLLRTRENESLFFAYTDLGLNAKTNNLADLRVQRLGEAQVYQHIDRDGDGDKDGVLVRLAMSANESSVLEFSLNAALPLADSAKMTQAEISHKTGGNWIPHPDVEGKQAYEGGSFVNVSQLTTPAQYTDHSNWIRYEGPGIESDKVGYRIYLDWRNGFDIFGKSTEAPVLQKVGLDGYESYHALQSWGMDILKVGDSLGAGGFAYWNGSQLLPLAQVENRSVKIIENGDIYSAFAITYQGWTFEENARDLNAQFSMQAGSRLVHTQISLSEALPNMAIGVVKHEGTRYLQGDLKNKDGRYTYIASWGQQSLNGDYLGMALIFKNDIFMQTADDPGSYLAVLDLASAALDYYFLAAWEGELGTGIASQEEFVSYLNNTVEALSAPLTVSKNSGNVK